MNVPTRGRRYIIVNKGDLVHTHDWEGAKDGAPIQCKCGGRGEADTSDGNIGLH